MKAVFKLDDAAGNLIDLSAWVVRLPPLRKTRDMLNSDTLDGSVSHSTTPGLRDGREFTVHFLYHPTPFAQLAAVDALDGTTLTYEAGPEGSAAGKPKLTGECYLKFFNPDSGLSATFIQTGTQTWSTF